MIYYLSIIKLNLLYIFYVVWFFYWIRFFKFIFYNTWFKIFLFFNLCTWWMLFLFSFSISFCLLNVIYYFKWSYLFNRYFIYSKINIIDLPIFKRVKLVYTFWIFKFISYILDKLSFFYFYENNLSKKNQGNSSDLYTYFLTLVLSMLGVNFYKNYRKISKFMFFTLIIV